MRGRPTTLLLLTLLLAGAARADVLVNDRSTDPPNQPQGEPRVATVFNENLGTRVLVLWNESPSIPRLKLAVGAFPASPTPPGATVTFTPASAVPAPATRRWSHDGLVRGSPLSSAGEFYVAGTVVDSVPTSHPHVGLGFVKGVVQDFGTVSYSPPIVVAEFGVSPFSSIVVNVLAMAVHPADNTIFIAYSPDLNGTLDRNVYFVRSLNGGDTWSPPTRLSTDSLSSVGSPTIVCGSSAGDVTFLWSQIGGSGVQVDSRHSTDGGVTLVPPVAVMTFPGSAQTAPSGPLAPASRAAAFDRWNNSPGSLVYATTTSFDLSADDFPDVATALPISEKEPNGGAATATAAAVGNVLRGAISAVADTDCFSFDLAQGQLVNLLPDSLSDALQLQWVGDDGRSVLTTESQGPIFASERFGFVAPATARYFLRIIGLGGVPGYRLRTMLGHSPAPGAADQRDVTFSRQPPAGSWNGTQFLAPADPIGYDATGVTLAAAFDGGVFLSYNDFSVAPGRAISRRVIRRSADGGATWSAPTPISSIDTDWANVNGIDGFGCDMTVNNGVNLFTVWVDGRNGDPDVYLSWIERRIYLVSSDPISIVARPGDLVHAIRSVRNADTGEPFDVRMIPDGASVGWALSTTDATLAPGETRPLDCAFHVPGDAVPGDYSFNVQYRSRDDLGPFGNLGLLPITVHVTTTTGVDASGAAALALAPVRPNPLTGPADVRFSLSRRGDVRLAIYDLHGRCVRTLVDEARAAGAQTARWDGRDERGDRTAAGEYFVVLNAEGRRLTRRIVALR